MTWIIIGRPESYHRRLARPRSTPPVVVFWAGSKFCSEYPDAKMHRTKAEALAEGANVRDLINRKLDRAERFELFVVSNYGLETEKEIPLQ